MKGSLGVLVALAVAAGPAYAQDVATKGKEGPGPSAAEVHKEGDYGGVRPGEGEARAPKRGKKPVVTWIGFVPQSGGSSRFFVQVIGSVDYEQDVVGNTLVVTIAGAKLGSRNVRRRLDTRFFDTSVRQVVPKQARARRARKGKPGQKAGVQLTFEFKNPADARAASASSKREQDGYDYLYLDFGPGSEAPADDS